MLLYDRLIVFCVTLGNFLLSRPGLHFSTKNFTGTSLQVGNNLQSHLWWNIRHAQFKRQLKTFLLVINCPWRIVTLLICTLEMHLLTYLLTCKSVKETLFLTRFTELSLCIDFTQSAVSTLSNVPNWKCGSAPQYTLSSSLALACSSDDTVITDGEAFTNVTPRFGFDCGCTIATSLMSSSAAATDDKALSDAESGRARPPRRDSLLCSVVFNKFINCFMSLFSL